MRKFLPLFVFVCCLCFVQCKKNKNTIPPDNPYGLPNATQEGKGIFACRVNGENWIVKNRMYTLGGGVRNDTLSISGSSGGEDYFHRLTLYISEVIEANRTYVLNNEHNNILLSANWTPCQGAMGSNVIREYATSGEIRLTKFDSDKKIIAGVFTCKIPIAACDTLNVTDGRFDIRFR